MARSPRSWLFLLCTALAVFAGIGCTSETRGAEGGVDGGRDLGLDDGGASEDRGSNNATTEPDAASVSLAAITGPALTGVVGEELTLDGSRSTGAVAYEWWPGDGRRLPRGAEASVRVRYDAPGRFAATLIVYDASGARRTAALSVTIVRPAVFAPSQSSTVAVTGDGQVAVVSPDSDELVFVALEAGGVGRVVRRIAVCDHPRTVARFGEASVAVACPDVDRVVLVAPSGPNVEVALPYGARPFGVLALDATRLAVSLQGTGELAVLVADAGGARLDRRLAAIEDARALARLPDGRVLVSRWRSPDSGGELVALDVATGARTPITLAVDPQAASDTENGGVPSYLESIAVSPDGTLIAIASLQASLLEGPARSGRPLRFDTTLRAVVSFVDGATLSELRQRRRQFDDRGFASAAVFSARGDFLYVATRGNRTVERVDVLRDVASGSLQDLGFALEGLALTAEGVLVVDAFLSRTLVAIDATNFRRLGATATLETEPLSAQLLEGARLFNDAADPRLGQSGYMACAHCHLDGLEDHRTWDFTGRGEGLRNTIELAGRAGTAQGPLHWSANFDEMQDFENDLRNAFEGRGLLTDADWTAHSATMGAPKAGLSTSLDALAAYVASLDAFARSPHRDADGSLPAAAVRGRVIFERASTGCTTCHAGARLTDSAFESAGTPRLHDVGTLRATSGQRLGGALTGLDTPTLHGVWGTAPYLHDGSAATLRDVLVARNPDDRHGATRALSTTELDDLIAYLECLDGRVD